MTDDTNTTTEYSIPIDDDRAAELAETWGSVEAGLQAALDCEAWLDNAEDVVAAEQGEIPEP